VEELDHHILVANRKQMVAISLRGACPLFGDFVRLRVGPDPAVSRTGELGERVNENRRNGHSNHMVFRLMVRVGSCDCGLNRGIRGYRWVSFSGMLAD
jgi:hypothetical protein